MDYEDLTTEQQRFIQEALAGRSILVDACIGSGKTTAIQSLCNQVPSHKTILYLTYNKLLKVDAQQKIQQKNADVTNYHSFAYRELRNHQCQTSVQECLQDYCKQKLPTKPYDILILDEYQDIDEEIANMLWHIKDENPHLQIIAVGDMQQKIYDKTRLNARQFIGSFLPADHIKLEFTQCFRLCASHAAELGQIWGKQIVGVNDNCEILHMPAHQVLDFVAKCDLSQVLCLGPGYGGMARLLNDLEERYPKKFNKYTVWAKISESQDKSTDPTSEAAVFTTYDGCKGMERDICVIFNWDEHYWESRIKKPNARYEIIRNIFCVAASRGKRKIVFVKPEKYKPLTAETLMRNSDADAPFMDMPISGMFDFKFAEDVEDAFQCLEVRELPSKHRTIDVKQNDGLIDLTPCLGIYQKPVYFKKYDIEKEIDLYQSLLNMEDSTRAYMKAMLQKTKDIKPKFPRIAKQVLYFTALQTGQNRYYQQVDLPFISEQECQRIISRLATRFNKNEDIQISCELPFYNQQGQTLFWAKGFADVVKDEIVYELKFTSSLAHVHFLECAVYMICLGLPTGRLWNIRTNQMFEIRIPNEQRFLDQVARTITKGRLDGYAVPLNPSTSNNVSVSFSAPSFDSDFLEFVDDNENDVPF